MSVAKCSQVSSTNTDPAWEPEYREKGSVTEAKNKIIMNVSWRPTTPGRKAEKERDTEGSPRTAMQRMFPKAEVRSEKERAQCWGAGHISRQWFFKKLVKILPTKIRLHSLSLL